MVAGWMANQAILGRKYTMVIGALLTSQLSLFTLNQSHINPLSGLFLCIYSSNHQCAKRRLQLRHRLHPQHLLRYLVRLHPRSPPFCPSCYWKRYRCRMQPHYGYPLSCHCYRGQYVQCSPDLCLRSAVCCHGGCCDLFPLRTLWKEKFLNAGNCGC